MNRNAPRTSLRRTATSSLLLAALAAACSQPVAHHAGAASPSPSGKPGQIDIKTGDIDLSITHAIVRLDPSGGGGALTMTLHNGGDAPEHLAMVATPGGGRGTLQGGATPGDGELDSAGILFRPGATVTFGGSGPHIRFTGIRQATTSHTLPLALEFGIAGLVHVTAIVQKP